METIRKELGKDFEGFWDYFGKKIGFFGSCFWNTDFFLLDLVLNFGVILDSRKAVGLGLSERAKKITG